MDTQLIMAELKHLRSVMEEIRANQPKRAKPKRKANPSKQEVLDYAKERGRSDLGERFFEYYTEGRTSEQRWTNAGDKPVYAWKSTFVSWERKSPLENTSHLREEIG